MPIRIVGILLLAVGLGGHLYAAHATGGDTIAYTHHILGFFFILAVTGGIIWALARRFWRTRPDVTFLAIGIVQAVLGIMVGAGAHKM
jgi:hypothetical protein